MATIRICASSAANSTSVGDLGSLNAAIRARTGIDPRDPSGDKRVFEFCYGIPAEQYVVGRQSRSLVRRAMKSRLPQSTLTRYKRGQQGVDWYITVELALPSFREELALQMQSPLARRIVDLPRLERLLDSWPDSGLEGHYATDHWNYALCRGHHAGVFPASAGSVTPLPTSHKPAKRHSPRQRIAPRGSDGGIRIPRSRANPPPVHAFDRDPIICRAADDCEIRSNSARSPGSASAIERYQSAAWRPRRVRYKVDSGSRLFIARPYQRTRPSPGEKPAPEEWNNRSQKTRLSWHGSR